MRLKFQRKIKQKPRNYQAFQCISVLLEVIYCHCRVNQQVQNYNILLQNSFLGVSKLSFWLGLELIFFCIIAIFLSVLSSKFACLDIYCLTSQFVFSIAPFCHEEQESAKQTTAPRYFVMSLCTAIQVHCRWLWFICSLQGRSNLCTCIARGSDFLPCGNFVINSMVVERSTMQRMA